MLQFGPDASPQSADPESMVIIDARGDGKFTFTVKFRGVEGPASRPMARREDVELLGQTLLRHMERNAPQRIAPAYLQAGDRPHL
jgi:hypothetical protein